MLKKSKRRKALKEFELLHKSDPEAALARLEELEQLRMQVLLLPLGKSPLMRVLFLMLLSSFCLQERMSLKHQNKGKWARSKAIMAKYDLEVRSQNGRRIWVGRDL